MLQSLMIRLETAEHERVILLDTMKHYNAAANYISQKAYEMNLANKYELQKLFYKDIRQRFNLSAQFAIRVISKVVEAYKRDKTIKPVFKKLGSIQYDQRNSKIGIDKVSIMTLQGRLKLYIRIGEYQKARFDRVRGQSDLIYRNGVFYLIVVVDSPEKSEYDPVGVLGIDLGIENIAVDSDREIFDENKKVEQTREYYNKKRAELQKIGSKSARRKLKRISGKERRFKKDINHVISKIIVSKAKGTNRAISIENLKNNNIRSMVTVIIRHSQRDRHSKWAFGQLRSFIEYKSKIEGVPLFIVDPKNTSRQCPECKYIDRRNRKSRNEFECLQCSYKEMADYVAARNIAVRAAVNQPMVAETLISGYKPPYFSRGS